MLVRILTKRHIQNSVDIPPNALTQVATTIEHAHRNHAVHSDPLYLYRPGQAFLAARRSSRERLQRSMSQEELAKLSAALERETPTRAPRQYASAGNVPDQPNHQTLRYRNSNFLSGRNLFRSSTRTGDPSALEVQPPVVIPQRVQSRKVEFRREKEQQSWAERLVAEKSLGSSGNEEVEER